DGTSRRTTSAVTRQQRARRTRRRTTTPCVGRRGGIIPSLRRTSGAWTTLLRYHAERLVEPALLLDGPPNREKTRDLFVTRATVARHRSQDERDPQPWELPGRWPRV